MNYRFLYALIFFSFIVQAQADDKWWFDVEVILFDRSLSLTELEEQFTLADNLRPVETELDVISDYLHPDISNLKQSLPVCGKYNELYISTPPSIDNILQQHETWKQQHALSLPADEEISQPSAKMYEKSTIQSNLRTVESQLMSRRDEFDMASPQTVTQQEIVRLWLDNALPPAPPSPKVPTMRFCREEKPWLSWENGQWIWHREDNSMPYPQEIKIELDGDEKPFAQFAHILPAEERELTKLSQQIRQARGLNRLLHLTWRQQVKFGQNKADKVRLFAGNDYSNQFTLTGDPVNEDQVEPLTSVIVQTDSEEDRFFEDLQRQLNSPNSVPFASMMAAVRDNERKAKQGTSPVIHSTHIPIWKLDGYLKVFLKYINRVPYLHIESELFYRQPMPLTSTKNNQKSPQYRLVSVPFQQIRRVISQQIHYFDHPLFGMVVQIRRHELPMDDE